MNDLIEIGSPVSTIRTRAQPVCHVCGDAGEIAYTGFRDRLFGVAGEWSSRRCRNPECGLLWLHPMPIEADLPRLYEIYYTHAEPAAGGFRQRMKESYWTARYADAPPARRRAKILAQLPRLIPGLRAQFDLAIFELPIRRGGRLLEIGCGNGSALRQMATLGWDVEGVDFDEAAVNLARSCGLTVRLGSVEAQHYPSNTFDAIVMSHVLEHVPNPRGLLAECYRILKSGGRLVSITPNAAGWGHKVFGRHWLHLDPPRHLHIFTAASLRKLACESGWSRPVVRASIGNSGGTILASYRLRREGHCDMPARLTASSEIMIRCFQAVAAARHFFHPDQSDELVLHAVKDAQCGAEEWRQ